MREQPNVNVLKFMQRSRINQLKKVYSNGCKIHTMIPVLDKHIIIDNDVVFITQMNSDEVIVDFNKDRERIQLLLLFSQLCSFVSSIHGLGVCHGMIHESLLYYSKSRDSYKMRGFDVTEDQTYRKADDIHKLASMLERIAFKNGLDISKPIDLLHNSKNGLAEAYDELRRMTDSTYSENKMLINIINTKGIERRDKLVDFNVVSVDCQPSQSVERVVLAMAQAVCVHYQHHKISLFAVDATRKIGMGWGPSNAFVNTFMNLMHSESFVTCEYSNIDMERHEYYNQMLSHKFKGLDILCVVSYVLMMSIYFDIPLSIPAPSRRHLNILMRTEEELQQMKRPMTVQEGCMYAGALPFANLFRMEGLTGGDLADYMIIQRCAMMHFNNKSIQRHQVRLTNFNDAQRAVFWEWMENYATGELVKLFIRAVADIEFNSPNQMYIVILSTNSNQKQQHYSMQINTCHATMHIFNKDVLNSVNALDHFMRTELMQDQNAFIYNFQ